MTTEQKKAIKSLDEFVNTKYGAFSVNEGRQILNLIQEQEAELKKKDKIINLMAKAFKQDDVRSVEEIKQFFERKVENDNSKE